MGLTKKQFEMVRKIIFLIIGITSLYVFIFSVLPSFISWYHVSSYEKQDIDQEFKYWCEIKVNGFYKQGDSYNYESCLTQYNKIENY